MKIPSKPIKSLYEVKQALGEDLTSYSYRGRSLVTQKQVLIWQYKDDLLDSFAVSKLIRNAEKRMEVQHPNLLTLVDYDYDGIFFYTIYEYHSDYISLTDMLQSGMTWTSDQLYKLLKQVIEAAYCMEQAGLLMGEINMNTILVNKSLQVKCSHALLPSLILHRYIDTFDVLEDALFYAPEYLQKQPLNTQTDVYSIGVLLYFLYSTKWPYKTTMSINKMKRAYLKPPLPANKANPKIGEKLNSLIMRAITTNPTDRIGSVGELRRIFLGQQELSLSEVDANTSNEIETQIAQEIRKNRGKTAFEALIVSISVIIPMVLLYGLYVVYMNYLTEIPKVDVPDVVGLRYDAAERIFSHNKLRVKKAGDRSHPLIPEGYIIETKPPAGREVKQTRPIRVFISSGSGETTVPNVVGRSLDQTKLFLQNSKIQLEIVTSNYSANYPRDVIMSQYPSANQTVEIGSSVQVVISKGYPLNMERENNTSFFGNNDMIKIVFSIQLPQDWPTQSIKVYAIYNDETKVVHEGGYLGGEEAKFDAEFEPETLIEAFFNGEVAYRGKIE